MQGAIQVLCFLIFDPES